MLRSVSHLVDSGFEYCRHLLVGTPSHVGCRWSGLASVENRHFREIFPMLRDAAMPSCVYGGVGIHRTVGLPIIRGSFKWVRTA